MNDLDTLGVEEAAEYLLCSKNTIRLKAASGEIPSAKIGKKHVFLRGELAKLIKDKYSEAHNDGGSEKCQSLNVKGRRTTTIVSPIRNPNITLRQEVDAEKKRNKSKQG